MNIFKRQNNIERLLSLMIAVLLIVIPSLSYAEELYIWTDERGTKHIEDRAPEISPKKNIKIEKYLYRGKKTDEKILITGSKHLHREGDFAVRLVHSLGAGTAKDEVEAESMLGDIGITPRNGWIADYPVTPDIIGELNKAVSSAANAGKLPMNKDEALKRLDDLAAEAGSNFVPAKLKSETK
jgi:hypothetical protein